MTTHRSTTRTTPKGETIVSTEPDEVPDFDTPEMFAAAHRRMVDSVTYGTEAECDNCGEVRPVGPWSGFNQCRRCVGASMRPWDADALFYDTYGEPSDRT